MPQQRHSCRPVISGPPRLRNVLDALEREYLRLNMCPYTLPVFIETQKLPIFALLGLIQKCVLKNLDYSLFSILITLSLKMQDPEDYNSLWLLLAKLLKIFVTIYKIVRLLVLANELLSAELQKSWIFRKNLRCCFVNRAVDVGPCCAQRLHQSQSRSTPLK